MLENDGVPEVVEPARTTFKATYIKMSGSEVFIWIFLYFYNKKEQCLRQCQDFFLCLTVRKINVTIQEILLMLKIDFSLNKIILFLKNPVIS